MWIIHVRLSAGSKAVIHKAEDLNAFWKQSKCAMNIREKKEEKLEKLLGAFWACRNCPTLVGGEKSPHPAPWDRPCFNAKVNDRPVSGINKEQLSCAPFSLPLSHTDRSLKLLGLVLLYLGLSTFLHFLKRAPNYVVLVFKLLIKITHLIYFSIFLHRRFNKRWPCKFTSKSTLTVRLAINIHMLLLQ